MGIGPIPYTAVIEYGRWHGYVGAEFETLYHCVRAMDVVRLEVANGEEELPAFGPGMLGRKEKPFHSKRPMTMELFDAIFS